MKKNYNINTNYWMPESFTREIYEHEVLLSFNGDDDAVAFRSWFITKGALLFKKYLIKQKNNE